MEDNKLTKTEELENLQREMNKLQVEIDKLKNEMATAADAIAVDTEITTEEVLASIDVATTDEDIKVETLCRWAAARAGVIVVAPLMGTVALMANEVYLVSRIAKVYDVKLSEKAIIAFLGAFGGKMAGTFLATLIPFGVIQIPIAVGITYSVGKVTQKWLKDGMPDEMQPYVDMMVEWKERAKDQVDKLKDNPLKDTPLGDETKDFVKNFGVKVKDAMVEVKEQSQKVVDTIKNHRQNTLVNEVEEEIKKAKTDADLHAATGETVEILGDKSDSVEFAADPTTSTEKSSEMGSKVQATGEKVRAAVEDAIVAVKEEKESI
jgi:uncharacterized protein (DUF697 family)